MQHAKPRHYELALTAIQEEFGEQMQTLADEVREALVVPLCKLYHLHFSGGVSYAFWIKRPEEEAIWIGDMTDVETYAQDFAWDDSEFERVFAVLELEENAGLFLGQRVRDVD